MFHIFENKNKEQNSICFKMDKEMYWTEFLGFFHVHYQCLNQQFPMAHCYALGPTCSYII